MHCLTSLIRTDWGYQRYRRCDSWSTNTEWNPQVLLGSTNNNDDMTTMNVIRTVYSIELVTFQLELSITNDRLSLRRR